MTGKDNDHLDSTGIDFKADPISDEDLDLFILAPDGDETKLEEYRQLFPEQAGK